MRKCNWCGRQHNGFGNFCSEKCEKEHEAAHPPGCLEKFARAVGTIIFIMILIGMLLVGLT